MSDQEPTPRLPRLAGMRMVHLHRCAWKLSVTSRSVEQKGADLEVGVVRNHGCEASLWDSQN